MQLAHIVRITDFKRSPVRDQLGDTARDHTDTDEAEDPDPASQAAPKKGERRVQLRIALETPDETRQALQILVQEAQHCQRILESRSGGSDMDADRMTAVRQRMKRLNRKLNARWQGQ